MKIERVKKDPPPGTHVESRYTFAKEVRDEYTSEYAFDLELAEEVARDFGYLDEIDRLKKLLEDNNVEY